MAGGAKSDEQFLAVNAGDAVMDRQAGAVRLPCPAGFTATAVAGEDSIAVSVEVAARMGLRSVAPAAESGDSGDRLPAHAKQDFLPGFRKPAA